MSNSELDRSGVAFPSLERTIDGAGSFDDDIWEPNEVSGFTPRVAPISPAMLGESDFASLRQIGRMTPTLGAMADAEILALVASLPDDLDVDPNTLPITDCEAAARAYVNLAAHLIHRTAFMARKEIPQNVARPLWAFSQRVKRAPSLTYASYVLGNCLDAVTTASPASAFPIAQTPSGTADEAWFVAVHLAVESAGGVVVAAINDIGQALDSGEEADLVRALDGVVAAMVHANAIMPTIRARLRPDIFRDQIRPLLYGHEEVRLCGVETMPRITYVGETGAQSGVIRAVDAILGVRHDPSMKAAIARFAMYAPPEHQAFIARAETLGSRLAESRRFERVNARRVQALGLLAQFRQTHLGIVTFYLLPDGEPLAELGTGGTHFRTWLKQLITETEQAAELA